MQADSASRRTLADLYLEQDLANLGGDEPSSEEDLGEGKRSFDFDPNKKESLDMYAQQILGYDKLIHDIEEKYLAATDWRAKGELKWQLKSVKKLLRRACKNYVKTTKPSLWSALNKTFLTSEHTVLNQCEKLAIDARPPMIQNATNATNHTANVAVAMAAVKAADANNDTIAKGAAIKGLVLVEGKAAREKAEARKAAALAAAAARLAAPAEASTLIMAAREMVQDDLAMLDESF